MGHYLGLNHWCFLCKENEPHSTSVSVIRDIIITVGASVDQLVLLEVLL
jgi:hypothetical protein